MTASFIVRVIITLSRERMPVVVNSSTGEPNHLAALFALTVLRPDSGSHSTTEQSLRGVAEFLTFLAVRQIDFLQRIACHAFLSVSEMDALVSFLYREKPRSPASRADRTPSSPTVAIRMVAIKKFVSWLFEYVGHPLRLGPERLAGSLLGAEFLKKLAARKPRSRPPRGNREGLSAAQQQSLVLALHELADAADASGRVADRFIADRTLLWFEWVDEFGHRIGEMLGIRIGDLDLKAGTIELVRRPDASDDPRPDLARLKGEGRRLPLSPYLTARIREHVDQHRAGRPGAMAHSFLFVSLSGRPLSRSSVNQMFERLRKSCPILGPAFTSHQMRHTWNENFEVDSSAAAVTKDEASEARQVIMGWSDPKSARFYLNGSLRKNISAISLHSQQRQMDARRRWHG